MVLHTALKIISETRDLLLWRVCGNPYLTTTKTFGDKSKAIQGKTVGGYMCVDRLFYLLLSSYSFGASRLRDGAL